MEEWKDGLSGQKIIGLEQSMMRQLPYILYQITDCNYAVLCIHTCKYGLIID